MIPTSSLLTPMAQTEPAAMLQGPCQSPKSQWAPSMNLESEYTLKKESNHATAVFQKLVLHDLARSDNHNHVPEGNRRFIGIRLFLKEHQNPLS